ncbi:MAG: hypothetical protein EB015_14520, partial [Methylocystaceae bacterium]|nr:hypothetical protein [Methylocystaceae bacterium]
MMDWLNKVHLSFGKKLQDSSQVRVFENSPIASLYLTGRRFQGNESGVVALIFAFVSFPLLLITAYAIETTQKDKNTVALQAAADSAALAAVSPGFYSAFTSTARQKS